jgi:Tol biopolymer transport system component
MQDAGPSSAPAPSASTGSSVEESYLFKVNVESKEQVQLTRDKSISVMRPVWSPDGNAIMFISFGSGGGGGDLYRVDADGSSLRFVQVTMFTQELFVDWR